MLIELAINGFPLILLCTTLFSLYPLLLFLPSYLFVSPNLFHIFHRALSRLQLHRGPFSLSTLPLFAVLGL